MRSLHAKWVLRRASSQITVFATEPANDKIYNKPYATSEHSDRGLGGLVVSALDFHTGYRGF